MLLWQSVEALELSFLKILQRREPRGKNSGVVIAYISLSNTVQATPTNPQIIPRAIGDGQRDRCLYLSGKGYIEGHINIKGS